jgi:hypothetical protein
MFLITSVNVNIGVRSKSVEPPKLSIVGRILWPVVHEYCQEPKLSTKTLDNLSYMETFSCVLKVVSRLYNSHSCIHPIRLLFV